MAISIISSVQSMALKLAAAIHGTPSSTSSSSDQVLSSMKKNLESMERTLRRIQAVLNDAEEREIGDAYVKLWLKELRWVAYDAENVLGEYHYEIRRAEIMTSASTAETSLKRKKPQDDQVYDFTSVLLQLSIPKRIRDIMERFEEISKARKDLQLRDEDGTRRHSISHIPQPSSSLVVDESGLFGREHDQEAVIQTLLSDKVSSKIFVISIVGMGGLGKTTLAQCVYNDPRVCQYFDSKGWVCVSEDFDVKRLSGEIIQSITTKPCDLTQSDAIQAKLKEIVDGKKVLAVLDDVWNEKQSLWEFLKAPFLSAATVRVLATTRNESVAKIMQTVYMHRLGYLAEDKCWSLFCHHAFSDRNPEEHPNLVEVGRKIMQKCGGLPLAVKTLGSLLLHYGTDEERWKEVLESEIWELDGAKDDILPALKLSYYRMPTHLKPCFLFTSLYPKDFRFHKPTLIKMWMAQGYILPRGNRRSEDIGSEYFDELQKRSFILDCMYNRYVLHDIVHDLARHVSEKEHHSVVLESDGKVCPIPAEVRHLFVRCQPGTRLNQVPLENTRDLRTIIVHEGYCDSSPMVDDHQFELPVHLRVLEVNYEKLPYSIGNLKHLCYLNCNRSHVNDGSSSLSINNGLSSLGHLYNIQTLSLPFDYNFVRLFNSLRDLANLRHLHLETDVSGSTCILPSMPEADLTQRGICYSTFSKLVEITLSISMANWVSFLPFSQLPSLRHLRLPHMHSIERVGHGNYCYCPLHLSSAEIRKSVITNNVGFPCLEELLFEDMSEWEEWFGVMDGDFPRLRKLTLRYCPLLSQIPLLPSSLKTLHIAHCDSLKSLPVNHEHIKFPCMEELVFEDLSAWEEWSGVNSEDFSCLHRLTIKGCHNLRRLPMLPSSLQSLHISRCYNLRSFPVNHGHVRFPYLEELVFENMPVWDGWSGVNSEVFSCLRRLTIKGCHNLRRLPMLPSSLRSLHISHCNSLGSLPVNHGHVKFPCMEELVFENILEWEEWSGVNSGDFPFLRKLTIKKCHKLRRLPMLPSSLQYLNITACIRLKFLPMDKNHGQVRFPHMEELMFDLVPNLEDWSDVDSEDFPCLRKLIIKCFCNLKRIPMLPSSLQSLHIFNCSSLRSLPLLHGKLSSLEELEVSYCPDLTIMAGLCNLSSLKALKICHCPRLSFLPDELLLSMPHHVSIAHCPALREWCQQQSIPYN